MRGAGEIGAPNLDATNRNPEPSPESTFTPTPTPPRRVAARVRQLLEPAILE